MLSLYSDSYTRRLRLLYRTPPIGSSATRHFDTSDVLQVDYVGSCDKGMPCVL